MDHHIHLPSNNLKSLRLHWRDEWKAATQVVIVSIPLSMGIAIASGAPPMAGLTSAILAGIIFPIIGGSYLIVGGPAAGLAPVIAGAIAHLGQGDPFLGYKRVLVATTLAGVCQIVLSAFRLSRVFQKIPIVILNAMLFSIGVSIIISQLPRLLGVSVGPYEHIADVFYELPQIIQVARWRIVIIGIILIYVLWQSVVIQRHFKEIQWIVWIFNPYLLVMVTSWRLAELAKIESFDLVRLPTLGLQSIVLPDFSVIASGLVITLISAAAIMAFVDTTETGMTVVSSDLLDKKFNRKSNPDRVLLAVGISNVICPLFGGLSVIPGPAKLGVNAAAEGKTLWVNAMNALLLIVALLFGKSLIEKLPTVALSVILLRAGVNLIHHSMEKHHPETQTETKSYKQILLMHVLIFAVTVYGTITHDLLVGVIMGATVYAIGWTWKNRQKILNRIHARIRKN